MNELVKLTARETVLLLKKKEVSPPELAEIAAARIAETDRMINALPTLCIERAMDHARQLAASRPEDPPPGYLYGLPIVVKDLADVKGVRTTYGSPIYADHVPNRSNYAVENLERHGAIVIAKSNTSEFGAGATTFNEVFGRTFNPWDTRMTPGGSSGGSAAALATGQIWLATGSDLGGSVRIPASYCSVVGLRPSPGRIPFGPDPMPFDALRVQGPMGRTVGDVALMLDAEVDEHSGDPRSLPTPRKSFRTAVDDPVRPHRVVFSSNLGIVPVDSEVVKICTRGAMAYSQLNIAVEDSCPDFQDAIKIFQTMRAALMAASRAPLLEKYRDLLKPELIWDIEKGLALTSDEIGWAERARGELYHRMVAFFENYDLLICPTVVAPPFDVNLRYLTEIEGVKFDSYIDWLALTFVVTLTACPAISIPCGFTVAGLPVGLQIIGPPRGEAKVLGAAALFEAQQGLAREVPIDPILR